MAQVSTQLRLEKPIRLASILEPSKLTPYAAKTKIIASLGPKSREVGTIESSLKAGMSVARFDFSWAGDEYHQQTLENLKIAAENTQRLCAVVKAGDMIYVGQYLFIGNEQTSVCQIEVIDIKDRDVRCRVKNDAILVGVMFTAHPSRIHIGLPTLSNVDKEAISKWGVRNNIDILSLSCTRTVDDVKMVRSHLAKLGDLHQTKIFAKISSIEALKHFDDILKEADGIILSRGSLGIDHPPEQIFLFQKGAIYKCNMAGKPVIITRVVDSMTETPRPTRAEATDVANAVLDGVDGILLGAETLKGPYPIETISVIGKICAEAEKVYNQLEHMKRTLKFVGEPMEHLESIISSAVRTATKMRAAVIIVFTTTGRAAQLVAKYRPSMPTLAVIIPTLTKTGAHWCFSGPFLARQCMAIRGVFPVLVDPKKPELRSNPFKAFDEYDDGDQSLELIADAMKNPKSNINELILKLAIDHAKAIGILKPQDEFVVCQKVVNSSVVKIMNLKDSSPHKVDDKSETNLEIQVEDSMVLGHDLPCNVHDKFITKPARVEVTLQALNLSRIPIEIPKPKAPIESSKA